MVTKTFISLVSCANEFADKVPESFLAICILRS